MKIQRLISLHTEIYKTINQLNPGFMTNIFKFSSSGRLSSSDKLLSARETIRPNQVKFVENLLHSNIFCKLGKKMDESFLINFFASLHYLRLHICK